MEQIYQNLMTPDWWFTGIFFVVIALVLQKIIKILPQRFKTFFRKIRAKNLKKIRRIRWCQSEINYEINKTTGRFFLFCLVCMAYLWMLIAYEPIKGIFVISKLSGVILTIPVWIVEIFWLFQESKVREIIAYQKKLHNKMN